MGDCSMAVVTAVASVLNRVIRSTSATHAMHELLSSHDNDVVKPTTTTTTTICTKFDSKATPTMDLPEFICFLCKYANCSSACLIVALILLDRISKSGLVVLTQRNIFKLVLLSIMTASKCLDDFRLTNVEYALLSGVEPVELNRIEVLFVFFLKFDLFVTAEEYGRYRNKLMDFVYSFQIPTPLHSITGLGCCRQQSQSYADRCEGKGNAKRYPRVTDVRQ